MASARHQSADLQSTYVRNLTHNVGTAYITKPGDVDCKIIFAVQQTPISKALFGVVDFPHPEDMQLTLQIRAKCSASLRYPQQSLQESPSRLYCTESTTIATTDAFEFAVPLTSQINTLGSDEQRAPVH